jgi:hypothetical protein
MEGFSEGDQVRNNRLEMGVGVITRHSTGPRSIRWDTGTEISYWVNFPDFHDPKWVDPHARGVSGWFRADALEPASPN